MTRPDETGTEPTRWTVYVCPRCVARGRPQTGLSLEPGVHYAGRGDYRDTCYGKAAKDEWFVDPDSALPFERTYVVTAAALAVLDTERARADANAEALAAIERVLGPTAAACCDGCEAEMGEALRLARGEPRIWNWTCGCQTSEAHEVVRACGTARCRIPRPKEMK